MDPAHPQYSEEEVKGRKDAVLRYFKKVDSAIARLIGEASEEKTMTYKILSATCPDELTEEINEHITEGWMIDGELVVSPVSGYAYSRYTQRMKRIGKTKEMEGENDTP